MLAGVNDEKELYCELDLVIERHRGKQEDLIQVLHWVQENFGYIPLRAQVIIADALGVSLTDVYGVVTFYSFFSLKPKGKYQVSCCKGTACYVRGMPRVMEVVEKELGIKPNDATDDGMFSFNVVRCLGACGLAPVMTVNKDTYGRLKPDNIPVLFDKYRKKISGENSGD